MKIITFYLPQFHRIPENDEWWGEGFTEWVNVKKATPLFEGHEQPVKPLDGRYYNLLDKETMKWQVELAKKYDVYGFCFYHYWFDGHMLLEKPVENYLEDQSLDLPYCICWANEHWTNSWVSKSEKVLIEQKYGREDEWANHFEYLLNYFKDKRYIIEDNMPLLVIYRPEIIDCLNEMLDYWNELAKINGFDGIKFAYQHVGLDVKKGDDSRFSYNIEYQPMYGLTFSSSYAHKIAKKIANSINEVVFKKKNANAFSHMMKSVRIISYDKLWKQILTSKKISDKSVPGAFIRWDNTPRKGNAGIVTPNVTPEKFEFYLTKQIVRARDYYKSDKLFLFAWNEWAEGGYLEPDEKYGYKFLEAVQNAQRKANEK